MPFDFYLGLILLAGGLVSLVGRIFKIERLFWKLEPMKRLWGERVGSIIHFIFYVIVPILIGAVFIFY